MKYVLDTHPLVFLIYAPGNLSKKAGNIIKDDSNILMDAKKLLKSHLVIVPRCLDFSASNHGENEEEALSLLTGSIKA